LTDALENYDMYRPIREAGQRFAQSISWNGVAAAYRRILERMQQGMISERQTSTSGAGGCAEDPR